MTGLDAELYRVADTLLRARRVEGRHTVAAAARTATGNIYAALDLRSRKSAVCGEPCAISAAHSAGDLELNSIVAVCFNRERSLTIPISPCGSCRELINYHQPGCRVIFQYDGAIVNVRAEELFRYPIIQVLGTLAAADTALSCLLTISLGGYLQYLTLIIHPDTEVGWSGRAKVVIGPVPGSGPHRRTRGSGRQYPSRASTMTSLACAE
jgi:cytidine deaminase